MNFLKIPSETLDRVMNEKHSKSDIKTALRLYITAYNQESPYIRHSLDELSKKYENLTKSTLSKSIKNLIETGFIEKISTGYNKNPCCLMILAKISPAKGCETETLQTKKPKKPSIKAKKKGCETETFNADDMKMAQYFLQLQADRYFTSQPKRADDIDGLLSEWANEFRKIRKIDKLEMVQINFLLKFVFEDKKLDGQKFSWSDQILTPKKLRQKNNDGTKYLRYFITRIKGIATQQAKSDINNRQIHS